MARRRGFDPLPLFVVGGLGAWYWFNVRPLEGATSPETSSTTTAPLPPAAGRPPPAPGRSDKDPRGVRNNNPGNILYSPANAWQGQLLPPDGEYARFGDLTSGVRAAMMILRVYIRSYGLNTVDKIAARWAPAPRNNPAAWAKNVSTGSGLARTTVINPNDLGHMAALMRGVITAEDGATWKNYADGVLGAAFAAAVAAG